MKKFKFGIIKILKENLINVNLLNNIEDEFGIIYLLLDSNKFNIEKIKNKIYKNKISINFFKNEDIKKDFDFILNEEIDDYYYDTNIKIPGLWRFKKNELLKEEKSRLEELLEDIFSTN